MVYLFDLWMTLVHSLPEDPVWTTQRLLQHKPGSQSVDAEFLTACLTTKTADADAFLTAICNQFNIELKDSQRDAFRVLIAEEQARLQKYPETEEVLGHLKDRHIRVGLLSNLWAFPVQRIFDEQGLGKYFEHLVCSFEVGARKPDARIFQEACRRFGVTPDQCLMIGDSTATDVAGALSVGMPAVLLNRDGKQLVVPDGVRQIRSLKELL